MNCVICLAITVYYVSYELLKASSCCISHPYDVMTLSSTQCHAYPEKHAMFSLVYLLLQDDESGEKVEELDYYHPLVTNSDVIDILTKGL